jgi:fatty-acyl-CoA synthase
MVLVQRFAPEPALTTIRDEGVSVVMSVPTLLSALVEAAQADPGPPPTITTVLVGAANVPARMITSVRTLFRANVHNLFGQTELSPVLTLTRRGDPDADLLSTVGRPLPQVEVRIVDPGTNQPVPLGIPGEICARGYQQLIEYYRDPQATAAAVDADGWLHLGDLGSMDDRGTITLTGRLKELIIRGGENIAPVEIENCLVEHPAVLEAAAVGLPDERWGEIVAVAVRLRQPLDDPEQVLKAHAAARLAKYKIPSTITIVEHFPMTASGKVQKFLLREQLSQRGDTPVLR